MSNIRGYYAEITTALTTNDLDAGATGKKMILGNGDGAKQVTAEVTTAMTGASGTFVVTVSNITANQTVSEWQSGDQEVAGCTISKETDMKDKTTIVFTFTVTADSKDQASTTYLSGIEFGTAG